MTVDVTLILKYLFPIVMSNLQTSPFLSSTRNHYKKGRHPDCFGPSSQKWSGTPRPY